LLLGRRDSFGLAGLFATESAVHQFSQLQKSFAIEFE
jgi:hypothetical protein